MSRRFALHLHPDKGHWQLPGSFSLNTHTYTHTHTHTHTHIKEHCKIQLFSISPSLFFFLSQTHTQEYYSATKKNEPMSFEATWMNPGIIILN